MLQDSASSIKGSIIVNILNTSLKSLIQLTYRNISELLLSTAYDSAKSIILSVEDSIVHTDSYKKVVGVPNSRSISQTFSVKGVITKTNNKVSSIKFNILFINWYNTIVEVLLIKASIYNIDNINHVHIYNEFYNLVSIVSGKYLVISFIWCIYLSYSFLNDKIIFTSYTSDNYNDFILNVLTTNTIDFSKFNIHYISNKILHPIIIFIQNL